MCPRRCSVGEGRPSRESPLDRYDTKTREIWIDLD